ncbi:MAG: 50S ribosomal protein L19 [Candidatus Omnitrophica bacterium]|nr:50S ribosomal protein L19 [Candidatus Omnitrophota bacterium]
MKNAVIQKIESLYLKKKTVPFNIGDTVKVVQKVTEGNKTRNQAFEGTVIGTRGTGINACFTVRRISFGEGVEKTFPIHSTGVVSVTVVRKGKVKRAKLYYLRNKSGKEGRIESAVTIQNESGTGEV